MASRQASASFSAHWPISRGFTLNRPGIECIDSFDDVMKDAIKYLPVRVTPNGSASSDVLAGRVAALSPNENQISNQSCPFAFVRSRLQARS